MQKYLTLADGTQWIGEGFGDVNRQSCGQVVFNTGMTGYQETITDPSYTNQLIAFTSPLIGNYGIDPTVSQSATVGAQGVIVHELATYQNHFSSQTSLNDFLKQQSVVGISEIDTRQLTKHLRQTGSQMAIISNQPITNFSEAQQHLYVAKHYRLTAALPTIQPVVGPHVVLIDFGEKNAIKDQLIALGCQVSVVTPKITWAHLQQLQPSGVLLSNGPGNPEDYAAVLPLIQKIEHHYPLAGICLGHQLLALANGADTYQLKFGHHGLNHPVQKVAGLQALITAQNHDYAVSANSLKHTPLQATYLEANDQSVEGLCYPGLPVFSVQFHPEANPGPHDAVGFFNHFLSLMNPEVAVNA